MKTVLCIPVSFTGLGQLEKLMPANLCFRSLALKVGINFPLC